MSQPFLSVCIWWMKFLHSWSHFPLRVWVIFTPSVSLPSCLDWTSRSSYFPESQWTGTTGEKYCCAQCIFHPASIAILQSLSPLSPLLLLVTNFPLFLFVSNTLRDSLLSCHHFYWKDFFFWPFSQNFFSWYFFSISLFSSLLIVHLCPPAAFVLHLGISSLVCV